MAEKRVHWADDVAPDEEGDKDYFVPPTPGQLASRVLPDTDDEDSLADSPSPPTPLTALAPIIANTDPYHTRYRPRASPAPAPILVPLHPFADPRVRSPDGLPWRFGEPSPISDRFRMAGIDRPLQPLSALGPSPRKSSAPSLPSHSRRGSVSGPTLHLLLSYSSNPSTPALVWNVGDAPSYSTVLMTPPNDGPPVPVPNEILYSPATQPPQREMRISCVGHSLWDPLVVHADELRPSRDGRETPRPTTPRGRATPEVSGYVTVMHVIRAIYRYLHIRMDSKEYVALKLLPAQGLQTAVARAFHERCDAEELRSVVQRASPERGNNSPASSSRSRVDAGVNASSTRTGGLRRLDCLLGQNRFLGLDNVPGDINVWYMRVASPRR